VKASGEGLRRGYEAADAVAAWSARLELPAPYVGWLTVLRASEVSVS
jgi:hypothetical protein